MVKIHCDSCSEEVKDTDFNFQAILREVKQTLIDARPQLVEKQLHLCKKCFHKGFDCLLK